MLSDKVQKGVREVSSLDFERPIIYWIWILNFLHA